MTNKENRVSSLELLKIILILMVVVLHYFNGNMGGLLSNVDKWSLNYFLAHIVESFCIIAVNVFVIITGYFSCKKNSIKISKVIKLYTIAIFYGIVICAIVFWGTNQTLNLALIKQALHTIFSRWFVVIYCILYLLIPFINKLVLSITKKELEIILIINAIVFYLWYTFFTDTTIQDGGYGIVNFINLYMIGAYIKLYKDDYSDNKKFMILYLLFTILTTAYSFFTSKAWSYATIFNLISSVSIFMAFKNLKIKNSKIINFFATYTFEIYIIHQNSFLAKILYNDIFKSYMFWNNNYMILHLIFTTIGIFLLCVLIEWIRRNTVGKFLDKQIDKINYKILCN